MVDQNKLQNDLKDAIKIAVLGVCSDHEIDETQIKYKLDLSAAINIEDEIVIQKGENDAGNS